MKVAVVYMSRHGSTEKIVAYLAKSISGQISNFNLADDIYPNIQDFDCIVIGGSIHYGSIQREIQVFCKRNIHELLDKSLALFVCCLLSTRNSDQFERAFPLALRAHCKASAVFEGDLIYNKLSPWERLIFHPTREERDVIAMNEGALQAFVHTLSTESCRTFTPYIPLES